MFRTKQGLRLGRSFFRRQRGATTLVVVAFLGIILSVMTLSFFIGRAAYHQHELQTGADAVVQAAALAVQANGLSGPASQVNTYTSAWAGNVTAPLAGMPPLTFQYDNGTRMLSIFTSGAMNIDKQAVGIENPGDTKVTASSLARIRQDEITEVTRDRAKVVLVLDYSGSMNASDFGGGLSRIEGLRQSVTDLINLGVDVQWGLVLYSSGILDRLAIADNNEPHIRAMISRAPGGSTCTSCALDEAGVLLGATSEKLRHVILVSDGLPNTGGGVGGMTSAADRLRINRKTAIFTIGVNAGGSLTNVMKRAAGDRGDPDGNDASFFYPASNRAVMLQAFMDILARILCQVSPQTLPTRQPDGTYRIFGFLRSLAGVEQPVHDKDGNPNPRALLYSPDDRLISIPYTPDCEKMLNRTHQLVLRYDWPEYAQ